MDNDLTATLSRFASDITYDDIPERVREYSKDLLLDALACALAGYRGEDTPKVTRFAAQFAQSQESSIIGGGKLSVSGATILNGFLITAVSMCDVYRPTATHLQPVIVSPSLAVAERDGASGRDLLVALVSGFETAVRIAAGVDYPAFRKRGWHGPGTIGPFGAAAAVGRLLGFDADHMATAFGLAGSQSAGTFAAWGTPSVKFHQFRGALSGLMAAILAEQGFVATREFLTAADGGFYSTYCGGSSKEAATTALGVHWEMEQIALRPWPTSAASQGVVTALFDLIREHDVRADRTQRLRIHVSPACFDAYAERRTFSGKWQASASIHYTAAVVLHDRELWMEQFERYDDPELQHFAKERIELIGDPKLTAEQAIVEAHMKDGTMLSAHCKASKGTPENPLTRAEIEDKFGRAASGRLGRAEVEFVLDAISHLEDLKSVRSMMDALRTNE
ncbi:MAG TPA: MmgE/PrpD family protein [Burkholderiales bacterium]|nr:MmgE/PrpD family protein [Burkholderiales bacterium]